MEKKVLEESELQKELASLRNEIIELKNNHDTAVETAKSLKAANDEITEINRKLFLNSTSTVDSSNDRKEEDEINMDELWASVLKR